MGYDRLTEDTGYLYHQKDVVRFASNYASEDITTWGTRINTKQQYELRLGKITGPYVGAWFNDGNGESSDSCTGVERYSYYNDQLGRMITAPCDESFRPADELRLYVGWIIPLCSCEESHFKLDFRLTYDRMNGGWNHGRKTMRTNRYAKPDSDGGDDDDDGGVIIQAAPAQAGAPNGTPRQWFYTESEVPDYLIPSIELSASNSTNDKSFSFTMFTRVEYHHMLGTAAQDDPNLWYLEDTDKNPHDGSGYLSLTGMRTLTKVGRFAFLRQDVSFMARGQIRGLEPSSGLFYTLGLDFGLPQALVRPFMEVYRPFNGDHTQVLFGVGLIVQF
jgi:hypothetical protein